ncbi:MAG: type II toxin-antitoxin system RelE/ParE family toxin [Alphaproteobacteria bacterium]|nr:type II toxin-antitoxin system RelE/ParE family toxin [Alphaproteobacteria bacterium]
MGANRRKAYLNEIQERVIELSANPHLGVSRDDVRLGYRSSLVGRHVIFYRACDGGIEIVRVLHDRMDVERQFYPS